ncbi:FkbM family methyltransferase, partial [Alphaproteobacteria bacterium]|nr:FkbM family methyltransferase [Alphaproteobacteria bacterium]
LMAIDINLIIDKILENDDFLNEKKFILHTPDDKWIRNQLKKSNKVHHEIYRLFEIYERDCDLILDIGANWGYSINSFRNAGVRTKIVSFEVNPFYDKCLSAFREIDYRNDYLSLGLAKKKLNLTFYFPILNNNPITALCSQNLNLLRDYSIYPKEELKSDKFSSLEIYKFEAACFALDELVAENKKNLFSGRIEGIKLDVEGQEYDVLMGAKKTINLYRPDIIIENNKNSQLILDLLKTYNYEYFDYIDGVLHRSSEPSKMINGVFLSQRSKIRKKYAL